MIKMRCHQTKPVINYHLTCNRCAFDILLTHCLQEREKRGLKTCHCHSLMTRTFGCVMSFPVLAVLYKSIKFLPPRAVAMMLYYGQCRNIKLMLHVTIILLRYSALKRLTLLSFNSSN